MAQLLELINTGAKCWSWKVYQEVKNSVCLERWSKCALSLSDGNSDNERSFLINTNTLSKERSSLSITALNGLRAVENGVRNEGRLSNVAVNKGMLVSVKSSHKAYLAHMEEERKNEDSWKRKSSEEKQQESEVKRRKEEDLKKIDGLEKSIKELD